MAAPTPVFPAGRYGRRREPGGLRRRPGLLVVLALVVLLLVAAGVLYGREVSGQVSSQVVTFDLAARSVRITFEVSVPGGQPATCTVRARNRVGTEVGQAQVPVPAAADGKRTVQVTYTLATRAQPSTGEVQSCRVRG